MIFWTPKGQSIKAKIVKCDYVKVKSFHIAKEIVNKMKKGNME
jgi:hypothetical protein